MIVCARDRNSYGATADLPSRAGGRGALASVELLADFYRRRNNRYAWHSSRQVEDLLRLTEHSVDEGFRPGDFHAREIAALTGGRAPSNLPASARVDAEVLLSDSLLRLIYQHRYGKVAPRGRAEGRQGFTRAIC